MADNTNTPTLPPNAGQAIGGSGTYIFQGYITAEEYSIDLQGKYALQVYDVMRRSDATIHAALNICKQPILSADWSLDPASDDPLDLEIAERCEYEFFGGRSVNFHDITREGLTFLDFGHFVAELVYEVAEYQGKPYIGVKSISSRKQRSILKWEQDDHTPGVTQILPSGKYVNIPRSKLLICVNDQEGENYLGVSLLRYCYKPWKIKDGLEIMNAVALENAAMGVPYIRKGIDGQTVDEPELEKLRTRLRQQRVNEESYLEYPASVEVGWMDMKGNTTKDVIPTIEYQDRQILLSVLGQFLLLGQADAAGSRAVSQDHSRLFVKALEAVAKQWQYSFQRDVINRWVDLNYSNLQNGYPKLVYSTISDEDVKEITDAVGTLMTAGALTADRDIENRLRTLLNLPKLSDDDYDNYADNKAAEAEAKKPQSPLVINQSQPDSHPLPTAVGSPNNPDDAGGGALPSAGDSDALDAKAAIDSARKAQKQLLSLVAGY